MSEKPITIRITGKVGYEDEITVAQAAQIIGFLNADTGPTLLPPNGGPAAGPSLVEAKVRTMIKVASPRAALEAAGAKTNPQKIVALAAWVLQDGGETFQLDAIKVQFQRAREMMPKNLSRDLASAITSGWVAESDMPGEYYLTNKVQNVLEGGFPVETRNGSPRNRARTSTIRTRRSGGPSKSAKPQVFASIDEFPPVLDGVLPYHRMPAQKELLLWALWFAKVNDIKGLTNSDAVWLTNELGAGIHSKHLTARFELLRKAGHANRSTVDKTLRITPPGEAYLKSVTAKNA
ncbi:MAG TPA: hypothetical protein DGG94_02960 [Micromonosporaceae bacterium]|nr:hypothetical protein [Micromonosporaceae bacterium]HCU48777.1 hypothetical protein [Micromonosporaceae bacterium]